jgi:hypothetical protein
MEYVVLFAVAALVAWIMLKLRNSSLQHAQISKTDATRRSQWVSSESGNPTTTYQGWRLTVFESDGGWKYCIADHNDRREPEFSEPYETKDIAMEEGQRRIDGRNPRNQSLPEARRALRRQREKEQQYTFLNDEPQILLSLRSDAESAANVTELRKVERKLETRKKYIDRVIDALDGVGTDQDLQRAKTIQEAALALSDHIQSKVSDLKAKPRSLAP